MFSSKIGIKFGSAIMIAITLLFASSSGCSAAHGRKSSHLSHNQKIALTSAAYDAINRLNHAKNLPSLAQALSNRSAAIYAVQAASMMSATISTVNDAARSPSSNIKLDPTLERDFQDLLKRYGIKMTIDRDKLEEWHLSNYASRNGRAFLSELGEYETRISKTDLNTKPSDPSSWYSVPIIINPNPHYS